MASWVSNVACLIERRSHKVGDLLYRKLGAYYYDLYGDVIAAEVFGHLSFVPHVVRLNVRTVVGIPAELHSERRGF